MPTNDERREVAARLREFEQLREVFTESDICAFADVLGVGYMDWERICARLANLIEPEERTCHVEHIDDDSFHLSCGHEAAGCVSPSFCPSCGARVEEGE